MPSSSTLHTFAGGSIAVFVIAVGAALLQPIFAATSPGPAAAPSQVSPVVTDFEADEADLYAPTTTEAEPSGLLHAPPIAYLTRVSGDPKVGANEIATRVPVLMYHRIRAWTPQETSKERMYTVRPDAFLAQMAELAASGYQTITPSDLERAIKSGPETLPHKPVLLTFDDGYREHFTTVLPTLKTYNLQATFFVISEASKSPAHMTDDMVREADRSGLITIASHTKHHWMVANLSQPTMADEIVGAKKDLETLLGHPVGTFAYPFGSYSPTVEKVVRDAGYTSAFGVRLGSLHVPSSLFNLRRIRVQDGEDIIKILDAFSAKP